MANRRGKSRNSDRFDFLGLQNYCAWWLTAIMKLRQLLLGMKAMTNLDSILKNRDIADKCPYTPMAFPVVLYGYKSWTIKKAEHRRTDAFILCCWRSLLRVLWSKEIKPVNPKGNQPWIFIGRTDAEAEAPMLWPPDAKIWLIRKDPDSGKDWRQKKGMTEDEMVR